jgi:hypothetical protein
MLIADGVYDVGNLWKDKGADLFSKNTSDPSVALAAFASAFA